MWVLEPVSFQIDLRSSTVMCACSSARSPAAIRSSIIFPSYIALPSLACTSNSFRRSQFRAACSRIAIDFTLRCRHRLARQDLVDALRCAAPERILHLPVFQRMEADHYQPPSVLEDFGRCFEQRPQVLEFMVYEDSDCLESFGRWMNALMFH